MKDIRPALRSLLLADATLSALVGGQRIFPVIMRQGEQDPSVVYNRITETADYHMLGPSGLYETLVQFDAWATTHAAAVQLADAVYDLLSGFSGLVGTIQIHGIFLINGRENYDSVVSFFRMSRDYRVVYWER